MHLLIGLAGILLILAIAFALSSNRRAIRLRVVGAAFLLQAGIAFVVSRTEIDFRAAARFNELLTVMTQVTEVKRASMRFSQQILAADGRLITQAMVQIACVSHPQMKPVAIPENVKGVLLSAR